VKSRKARHIELIITSLVYHIGRSFDTPYLAISKPIEADYSQQVALDRVPLRLCCFMSKSLVQLERKVVTLDDSFGATN
jgi:hypothetical protein